MSELKQDVEKVVEEIRKVEGNADAATQRALGAVNRQASWVERHPKAALGIVVGAVIVALICVLHAL